MKKQHKENHLLGTKESVYLVGGAVRDQLLGLPIKDQDWLVIGATPQRMIELGFTPIGKNFPVFLHPHTHQEYALARTERKEGHGYHGFVFYTDPSITLEEDLKRRDFTINAMAQDASGRIHDPFHGQEDLKNRLFRHVSPAFVEDPLRVIRLARFMARLEHFQIAQETVELCQTICASNELHYLSQSRLLNEINKAFTYTAPSRFFDTLVQLHAFKPLFPELDWDQIRPTFLKIHPKSEKAVLFYWVILALHHPNPIEFLKSFKTPSNIQQLTRTYLRLKDLPLDPFCPSNLYEWIKQGDGLRKTDVFLDAVVLIKTIKPLPELQKVNWPHLIQNMRKADIRLCSGQENIPECIKQQHILAIQQSIG